MTATTRTRAIAAASSVVLAAGFLLFRPDTLFTDVPVDESLEEAFEAPATTASLADSQTTTGAAVTATSSTAAAEPVAVVTGAFTGIDHRAAGTVTVYERNGRQVLRFEEDTDIQNGPDLYVWVLASDSYEGGTPARYLDLGKLTGNIGGQNYELPGEYDSEVHRVVLIWCLRFSVPFASAPLG